MNYYLFKSVAIFLLFVFSFLASWMRLNKLFFTFWFATYPSLHLMDLNENVFFSHSLVCDPKNLVDICFE